MMARTHSRCARHESVDEPRTYDEVAGGGSAPPGARSPGKSRATPGSRARCALVPTLPPSRGARPTSACSPEPLPVIVLSGIFKPPMGRNLRLAAIGLSFLIVSSAAASSTAVRVRVAPSNVTAGNSLFVTAGVRPAGKICGTTITRPGASAAKLAKKKAANGAVSWRWKVPRTAKGGSATARVTCAGAGTGSARFRIKPLPPPLPPVIPARVVAVKSGVAGRLSSIGSWFVGYGVVLQNVSPDQDALDVDVLVNILDAGGRILESDSNTYEAIPAGATYYGGGEAIYEGAAPARTEVTVQVRNRQAKSAIALPPVSNVRVTENFGTSVLGEVANPSSTRSLSDIARITVVCFDAAGNVIGGGRTYPPTTLPPGGRAAFDASIEGLSPSQIASVQVSVEPEYE